MDYRRDQAVDDLLAAQDALGQRAQGLQQQIGDLEADTEPQVLT